MIKVQATKTLVIASSRQTVKAPMTTEISGGRAEHHLVFVSTGSCRVLVNGRLWSFSTNRFILIHADTNYEMTVEAASIVRTLHLTMNELKLEEPFRVLEATPLLKEVALQILRIKKISSDNRKNINIFAVLKDLLTEEQANTLSVPLPKDKRALEIYELIAGKHQFDQSFQALADKVGASKRTLERVFRAEIGMTFSKWRQLLRLQQSLVLLDQGHSVAEISGEIGYGSSSAFIHAFKEYFGYSPGQYLSIKK